jgi:hypothetical protein
MDPQKCQALTTTAGTQCKTKHTATTQYCARHNAAIHLTGPHAFAREQMQVRQKFERKAMSEQFKQQRREADSADALEVANNRETIEEAYLTVRHRNEYRELRRTQEEEIAQNGGRDPDAPARLRREVDRHRKAVINCFVRITNYWNANPDLRNIWLRRLVQYDEGVGRMMIDWRDNAEIMVELNELNDQIRLAFAEYTARGMQEADLQAQPVQGWGGELRRGAVVMAVPNRNVLAQIANDNQNVHTTLVVDQTKKNVQEILKIPVPEDYKWQSKRLSLTYKTIIMFCHLSPKSAWQFSSMYCSDATIYDLEPGIFGKVVDGVWQFISKSPDKADLKKILTSELRDNIGMCAQGNLSRICNVLQGYLEGIVQKESVAEILGREFPKLMEIEDQVEREARGAAILRENAVPEGQWENWLAPLRA